MGKHFLKAFGINLILFTVLVTTKAFAQVVIKESVEIKGHRGQTNLDYNHKKLTRPGWPYHPVLQQVGPGKYRILKSGNLKFYFEQAEAYGVADIEDHVLEYTIKGPQTNIEAALLVADYMDGPIVLKDGSDPNCSDRQTYFESTKTYPLGPTDDTYISRYAPETNYGENFTLDANGYGFDPYTNPDAHPDDAYSTAFLGFGIDQFWSNATLSEAYLLISTDSLVTQYSGDLFVYRVNSLWDQESLTYENRPGIDVNDFVIIHPYDTLPGPGNTLYKPMTDFINEWVLGTKADYGIQIASTTRHVFVSREAAFDFLITPTLGLTLTAPSGNKEHTAELGYAQAGDTLSVNYLGLPNQLENVFSLNEDSVEADNALVFFESTGCQANNLLRLLPIMEEDLSRYPYFKFELSQPNNFSSLDTSIIYQDFFMEPLLRFDNGTSGSPEEVLTFSRTHIYDVASVEVPGLPIPLDVALLDDDSEEGTVLSVLTRPEARGTSFKIRTSGELLKGATLGKVRADNPGNKISSLAEGNAFSKAIDSHIEDDPYCGQSMTEIPEGIFISCFEFTIGSMNQMIAEARPDSIAAGDTTLIHLNYVDVNGDTVNFPSDQIFSAGIEEAFQPFGTLLRPDETDTADVFQKTLKGFSFIASPAAPDTTISVLVDTDFNGQRLIDIAEITIRNESLDILLGESKFFYAIEDPENDANLLIKELDEDPSSEDPLSAPSGAIASAFSGDDIIDVVSGGKSGVYWERKRALIDNSGSITVQDLPDGVVRVIGRYWEAGKAYKVKLKAVSGNRTGALEITVVRPDELGDKYGKAKDVFDNVINVDSLIIANAGKYGIPPQLLKAHISGEVYTKDFGPGIGEGFTPGYLYEPFTVEWWLRDDENEYVLKKEWKDNAFSVSSGSMGSGDAVPTHLHTEKQTYSANPVTIWEMVNKYSSISGVTPSGGWNSYFRKKRASSQLNFYYSEPRRIYEGITEAVRQKNKNLESDEVYSTANDSLITYLKKEWRGGLDSLYAQTRIASSYGFFQFLYTSAILSVRSGNGGANYSRSEIPEKLNEIEVNFRVTMTKYNELLKENTTSMWTKGYEQTWFELISKWNSKSEYSSNIYKNIKNFLPLDQ